MRIVKYVEKPVKYGKNGIGSCPLDTSIYR